MKEITIAGHKVNAWWLIGGAAGAVGVFVFFRHRSSSGAAQAAAGGSSSQTDPVTGLPYSMDDQVDPATGLAYLQEAQEYGSVQAAEEAVTSGSAFFGDTGAGDALDSGVPTISPGVSTQPGPGTYTSNAQWSQAVTTGLVSLGYSAQDVATALGLYFQSQPLGTASDGTSYLAIIQAAVAEFGPPPVGTYAIVAAPTSGGSAPAGGGGTGGGGTTAPPPAAGTTAPPQHFGAPPGLSVTPYANAVDMGWQAPAGATATTQYHAQVLKGGVPVPGGDIITTALRVNVTGLAPRTGYSGRVSVDPDGAWTAARPFTTT